MANLEKHFQKKLIRDIKNALPGCFVFKMDANYIQGIPDLLILFGKRWGFLECKRSATAAKRPNQQYYIDLLNQHSFAKFIYPENKEEVLNELYKTLKS